MPQGPPNYTILIVEDNSILLQSLRKKFENLGYNLLLAKDGSTALNTALQHKPDIILLDLIMPKLKGQDVLQKLRQDEWGKTVPVIVFTNDASEAAQHDTLLAGAPAYFIKSNTSLKEISDAVFYHLQS